MNDRKRPVIQRIRTLHRWISLCFSAVAVALIIDALIRGATSEMLSLAALLMLVLLLLTGGWLLVHHYTATRRATPRRALPGRSPQVAAEPE